MLTMPHLHFTGYHYNTILIICYLYYQYTNIVFYDLINKYLSCNVYLCNGIILKPS